MQCSVPAACRKSQSICGYGCSLFFEAPLTKKQKKSCGLFETAVLLIFDYGSHCVVFFVFWTKTEKKIVRFLFRNVVFVIIARGNLVSANLYDA
jgi:hypothetical protein